jgi:hypothetical protein
MKGLYPAGPGSSRAKQARNPPRVGYPIVHSCMMGKRGMGDRESNLDECRTHVRPVVSKCIEAAMMHGQSQITSAGEAELRRASPNVWPINPSHTPHRKRAALLNRIQTPNLEYAGCSIWCATTC